MTDPVSGRTAPLPRPSVTGADNKPSTSSTKPATTQQPTDQFVAKGPDGLPLPVSDAVIVPTKADELFRMFPDLKDKSPADVVAILQDLDTLARGDFSDKATALARLAMQFPSGVRAALDKLHLGDSKLIKLATNEKALHALNKLSNPEASTSEKALAALTLARVGGNTLGSGELGELLKKKLKGTAGAEKLVKAVVAWTDEEASGLDKAKATLDVAAALKESVGGKESSKLAGEMSKLDGPMRTAGAAVTLLDDDASAQDKALATAQLAADIPDLQKDVKGFRDLLTQFKVNGADNLVDAGLKAAAEVPVPGLSPQLAAKLSPADATKLKSLAGSVGEDGLKKLLANVGDADTLKAVLDAAGGLEGPVAKKLVGVLGGMPREAISAVVKDPALMKSLATTAGKLGEEGAQLFGKLASSMDKQGLETLLKFADQVGPGALETGLKTLEPILEKGGGKLVGKALGVLDKTLGKLGVKLTEEVAAKALKSIAKAIPIAGVVPNVIDAARYGKLATDLRDKNKDLGYLAVVGAGLNTADAVVGTVLDFTGVGVVADLGVGAGFAVVEMALDMGFDAEKAKFDADPKNYKAPDWVKAVNVGASAAAGPAGIAALTAYYGPEEGTQLIQWGVEKGAKGALELGKAIGVGGAEVVGNELKAAGGAMHAAADVLRNPSKYSKAVVDAAQKTFEGALAKGGEIAAAAKREVGAIVDEAVKLGAKGLDTLKWLATNPGEVAKIAVDGIKGMIDKGIDLTKTAGKAVYKKAVETLQTLQTGWEKAKKLPGIAREKATELIESAGRGITAAMDKAVSLGKDGMELVTWAATHPGELAEYGKKALTGALQKGGEIAVAAWDGIRNLGEKGLQLAEDGIQAMKAAGAAGVEGLKYAIKNPGQAAQQVREWAGRALTDMAKGAGDGARSAARAIGEFIDARMEWANKFGREMLKDGTAAFKEVLQSWKTNLSEGASAFISGLRDLGDAGVGLLKDIAKEGGRLAEAAVGHLKNLAAAGSRLAHEAIDGLRQFGGDVAAFAGRAWSSIANYDVKVLGLDITPWN